jgi:hypothetical protein
VAQGEGPEFKPQYHKKKREREDIARELGSVSVLQCYCIWCLPGLGTALNLIPNTARKKKEKKLKRKKVQQAIARYNSV